MLTSLSETFPYSLTEGIRLHCATIASEVGGVPVLIENGVTGLLFRPGDTDELAKLMLRYAREGEARRAMAERLYESASRRFSIDATVAHQREIYETILRREPRRGKKRDGVLICGAYGKGNAGDDAILEAICAQLRSVDPDLPLYVLSRTPTATAQRYRIGAIYTFNYPAYIHRMRQPHSGRDELALAFLLPVQSALGAPERLQNTHVRLRHRACQRPAPFPRGQNDRPLRRPHHAARPSLARGPEADGRHPARHPRDGRPRAAARSRP